MNNNPQNDANQLKIELSPEVVEGVYSNLAVLTHSSAEFIFDFVRVLPGTNKAPVKSRVVMAPEHAKRLLFALQNNIAKYESTFGKMTHKPAATRRMARARFVCVFRAFCERVFRGQKICALYFKICLTYFELCQTYFLFAPMWGLQAENQFSIFGYGKRHFEAPVFTCFSRGCWLQTYGLKQPYLFNRIAK